MVFGVLGIGVELRGRGELEPGALGDLDAAFERAQKLGMRALDGHGVGRDIETRPWGERSFYGVDPSGNPICFVDDQTLYTGSS